MASDRGDAMSNNRVLVVAAHPDDEVLGCGGCIARHVALNDQVDILIVAEGVTSRVDKRDINSSKGQLEQLRATACAVAVALGANQPRFLGLPDNRLDDLPLLDVIKQLEKVIAELSPNIIYTHHGGDLNIDHRIVHEAVMTACRPVPDSPVRSIFCFEVPSSTEWRSPQTLPFLPNTFVNISEFLDIKLKALSLYQTEMLPWPHARSLSAVEALTKWRGASVGCNAAEALMLIRSVHD
jgi:LmbE family N-acetylglucosaminyl deacetylase